MIAAYKKAFNAHPTPIKDYYSDETVKAVNSTLRDAYHLLWTSHALSQRNDALGFHCAPELRSSLHTYLSSIDQQYAVHSAFSLSNNTWLASLSAAAWRELEEEEVKIKGYDRGSVNWHKGPVTQRSLEVLKRNGGVEVEWEAYRVRMLKWCEERGLGGMKEFVFASNQELRTKHGGEAEKNSG